MRSPLFSVIVTTHCRPELLQRSLISITSQNFADIQIVLIDDEGSSKTRNVAAKTLREKDLYVSVPGLKGPSDSRNLGLHLATGRCVLFLDDDDSFETDFFSKIADIAEKTNNDVYFFDYCVRTEKREFPIIEFISQQIIKTDEKNFSDILVMNFIPNNNFLVSRKNAREIRFDNFLQSHEDWDFLIALSKNTSFQHYSTSGPIIHQSISGSLQRNQQSKTNNTIGLDYLSIYRKWPADDIEIQKKRAVVLQKLGVSVPPEVL